jgi:hypothetical protein
MGYLPQLPLSRLFPAGGRGQRAQNVQIHHVFVQVSRFRRFEASGMIFEARVIHNMPEAFPADLSLSNVRMTIDA